VELVIGKEVTIRNPKCVYRLRGEGDDVYNFPDTITGRENLRETLDTNRYFFSLRYFDLDGREFIVDIKDTNE